MNLDFSKSMLQLLESLGDLNENLREGFGIVAVALKIGHEDMLLRLEHNILAMNTAIQNTQSLSL